MLSDDLTSLLSSTVAMTPMEDLHISLSRTVVLQHHWIEPFTQSLKDALTTGCFMCDFESVEMYSNDEKTR